MVSAACNGALRLGPCARTFRVTFFVSTMLLSKKEEQTVSHVRAACTEDDGSHMHRNMYSMHRSHHTALFLTARKSFTVFFFFVFRGGGGGGGVVVVGRGGLTKAKGFPLLG